MMPTDTLNTSFHDKGDKNMRRSSSEANSSGEQRGLFRQLLPLLVMLAIIGVVYWQGWYKFLSPKELAYNLEAMQNFIRQNLLTALLVYIGIYIAVVALSLPGAAILSLAGGLLFGWVIAAPATLFAATVGAVIIFLIVRSSIGEPLAAQAGPWLDGLRKGFQEDAFNYLLFLRLVPAIPFVIVNIAPALLGVPLRTYVWGTALGIIPGTVAFAYLGRGLASVLEAGRESYEICVRAKGEAVCDFPFDLNTLVTQELIIAFAALGVVSLIPVAVKKLRSA